MGRITAATIADHVVPHRGDVALFFGGELQSLCKTHHDSAKQAFEKSGKMRGCDVNGYPS
jgi:5-methylcytosine-specific restriction protein A